MKEKFDLFVWKILGIITFISIWAGVIKFTERDLSNKTNRQKIGYLFLDIFYACFFGIIGFLLAREAGLGINGSAGVGGIFAHEGAKMIVKIEDSIIEVIKSYKKLKK